MFLERKDFCSNELSVCQMVYLLLTSMSRDDFKYRRVDLQLKKEIPL